MYERNSKRPGKNQTALAHFNTDIHYPSGAFSDHFSRYCDVRESQPADLAGVAIGSSLWTLFTQDLQVY